MRPEPSTLIRSLLTTGPTARAIITFGRQAPPARVDGGILNVKLMKLALKHARLPRIAPAVKPRISVCHVVATDMWAGAEAQIAMLLAELSLEPELSLCAIALGEGRLTDELRACNIDLKVISQPHGRFMGCYREARDWLRGRDVQIIHSHKSKENILALLLAKKIGRASCRERV